MGINQYGRNFGYKKSYFGQDTYGHDVKAFGATTGKYFEWDESADTFKVVGNTQFTNEVVEAKTADYTVLATDSGKTFTTTGATGAVNFTLPAKASGLNFTFVNTVDQNMTVTSDAVDTIITFNDVAADSVAFSTVGEKIGGAFKVICDGTKWIVINISPNTATVAT